MANIPHVMPGLVPGIHVFLGRCGKDGDGRDKPGHDGLRFWKPIANLMG
jgi:hypothetical protein